MLPRSIALAVVFAFISYFSGPRAWGADPLHYQFKATTAPIYEITIRADTPEAVETHSGHIFYEIKSVDPVNGQITFGYTTQFRDDKQQKQPQDNGGWPPGPRPPVFPPMNMPSPWAAPPASPEIVVDSLGNVLRTNRAADDEQLPCMQGLSWQLLIQPLSSDKGTTWKTQRAPSLYTKSEQPNRMPGPPMMMRQQPEERTERPAHETIAYTLGPAKDNTVTIQRQIELSTDEKVGDSPLEKMTGDGQFVFDTQAGLVQSLDFKETIEFNQENMTVKIPFTVKARLLTADEAAKLKADMDAAAAKAKANAEASQAKYAAEHVNDVRELPDGAVKTEMVGGKGGMPYVKVNKDRLTVIGFTIKVAHWGDHDCLRQVEPLYEKPTDMHPEGATVCLAKDGYVVGGIVLANQGAGADGIQVIFMKRMDKGVDVKDRYVSPWFGYNQGPNLTQLAGKGERVIGTFGRQGLNMDALGLGSVSELPARPGAVDEAAGLGVTTRSIDAEIRRGGTTTPRSLRHKHGPRGVLRQSLVLDSSTVPPAK